MRPRPLAHRSGAGSSEVPEGFSFVLVSLESLHAHEEIQPAKLEVVVEDIRQRRIVEEPLLVSAGSFVVLNGHHRFAALRSLGARLAPCWVVEYTGEWVRLQRWPSSHVVPPPTKDEVVRRALEGRLYPPKTTLHTTLRPLPLLATPLEDLL